MREFIPPTIPAVAVLHRPDGARRAAGDDGGDVAGGEAAAEDLREEVAVVGRRAQVEALLKAVLGESGEVGEHAVRRADAALGCERRPATSRDDPAGVRGPGERRATVCARSPSRRVGSGPK
jgi:hypothetical protein